MYISKQKLDEIKKEYSTLIMTDSDVVDAFNLVHDILIAEAEAIRAKASSLSVDWNSPLMKPSLWRRD